MELFRNLCVICVQLLLIFKCGLCLNSTGQAVKMVFSPSTVTEGETPNVTISCQVVNPSFKSPTMLVVRKASLLHPIAYMRFNETPVVGNVNIASRIKNLVGNVKDGEDLYFNITLTDPTTADSGDFKCVFFYITELNSIGTIDSFKMLTVLPQPIPSTTPDPNAMRYRVNLLESILVNLIDRSVSVESSDPNSPYWVISLSPAERQDIQNLFQANQIAVPSNVSMTKVTPQMQAMTNRLAKLEAYVMDLTEQNTSITVPDSNNLKVAFSATLKMKTYYKAPNGTLPFPDVEVNEGQGYDNRKGTFTAPVAGLYVFQVTLSIQTQVKSDMEVALEINSVDHAYLTAASNATDTISPVASLLKGDVVRIKVLNANGNTRIYGGQTSRFSGFLIN